MGIDLVKRDRIFVAIFVLAFPLGLLVLVLVVVMKNNEDLVSDAHLSQ